MKINSIKTKCCFNKIAAFVVLLLLIGTFQSCKDDYYYDEREPDNLGSSIYDYLNESGNFKITVKLIDDLEYTEVMKLTGSKTLFAANDQAYEAFFNNNPWNVKKYEDLSLAQKKLLLNFSMLNNSYTIRLLSN